MHWVGLNVHSEFSTGCYRRAWINILATLTLGWQQAWNVGGGVHCEHSGGSLWLSRDSLPRSRLSAQDRTCVSHKCWRENSGNPGQANAHKCPVPIWLLFGVYIFWWCCFCLVAKLFLTLCNSMDCSTPGFPVLHCLPEFAQTHAHWVGDALQPSHPLSSPSPPVFNLSPHQGLFQWVGSFHQAVKVLELQLQSF